ncbi:hypothetical protein ACNF40_05925 [Cuniculiplasma sp. SKW4]|uniref:hypothetical protein n=1 Tax=Cuniculiplasma sp. SKW4 TaxID=3400171 RepID=UPI003FD47929
MRAKSVFFRIPISMGTPEEYLIPGNEKEVFRIRKVTAHYVYKTAILKRRKRDKGQSKKGMLLVTDKRLMVLLDHLYYTRADQEGNVYTARKRLKKGTFWEMDMSIRSWFNGYLSNSLVYSDEFKPFVEMEVKNRVIPVIQKVAASGSAFKGRKTLIELINPNRSLFSIKLPLRNLVPIEWNKITGYKRIEGKILRKSAVFLSFDMDYSDSFFQALEEAFKKENFLSKTFSSFGGFSLPSIFPSSEFIGYDLAMNDEDIEKVIEVLKNAGIKEITDSQIIEEAESAEE